MVVAFTTSADKLPATLLLLEIKTGGVGKEEEGYEHASKTEPRNNVELLLGGDIVVHDSCGQSTELTASGREAVSSGTDGCGIDLGCDEESDRIRAELIEERRKEIHSLERADVGGRGVVLEVEAGNNEKDEVHEEADHLHFLASIELVVNEEGCE